MGCEEEMSGGKCGIRRGEGVREEDGFLSPNGVLLVCSCAVLGCSSQQETASLSARGACRDEGSERKITARFNQFDRIFASLACAWLPVRLRAAVSACVCFPLLASSPLLPFSLSLFADSQNSLCPHPQICFLLRLTLDRTANPPPLTNLH